MDGKGTSTLRYEDGRGKEVQRTISHTVDARDFLDTAVYPWIVMAANRHLSSPDIARLLGVVAETHPAVYRPLHWIKRRMPMVRAHGTKGSPSLPDSDGKQAHAVAIMCEHTGLSLRDLTKLLKERGICRSREWVRKHRYDHYAGVCDNS